MILVFEMRPIQECHAYYNKRTEKGISKTVE